MSDWQRDKVRRCIYRGRQRIWDGIDGDISVSDQDAWLSILFKSVDEAKAFFDLSIEEQDEAIERFGKKEKCRMDVRILEYVGRPDPWRAADLMIFTKTTRVEMRPDALEEIASWPEEKKMEELAYMANTIPSSWEFSDYTFVLTGVTRALTHQLVRTRTASYAQQTMQVLDLSAGWEYLEGPAVSANEEHREVYERTMASVAAGYKWLVENGAKVEDARGLLPTHVLTNIVVKMNLRTIVDLLHARLGPRNLGEFRDVAALLRDRITEVHPWASLFLDRTADRVLADLDAFIESATTTDRAERNHAHKLVDQLRRRT